MIECTLNVENHFQQNIRIRLESEQNGRYKMEENYHGIEPLL